MKALLTLLFIMMIVSCRDQYSLPEETRDLKLLVIEGTLNSGAGTMVRLSRTLNPTDAGSFVAENGARVIVEGENNTTSILTGNNSGEYTHAQLNLSGNQKYRLRITTTDGKEYLSDFVPVLSSPPIDSVHWKRTDNEVDLLVSTHDPLNNTWYYRWEFDETWEIHSYFISHYQYIDPSVVLRPDPFSIYFCWKFDISKAIILNSSAKLSQDVISGQLLHKIPVGTEKISVRYSILVKQYALTREAYQFWETMKKNTEQLGTLFDPQPSQLLSNIRCVNDPDETIIGYVSACAYSEKRIFIRFNEVLPWPYRRFCEDRVVPLDSLKHYFSNRAWIPLEEEYSRMSGRLIGYTAGIRACVDCTTSGTPLKPTFW
jgi:hypothetical protein